MTSDVQTILCDILANGADIHRCAAASALARAPGSATVAALVGALRDEDPDVRTDAAQALGALNDPASAPALMENLIGDPDSDVKKAALEALIAFGHAPVEDIVVDLIVSRSDAIAWDDDEFYSEGWDSWLDLQLTAIRGAGEMRLERAVPGIVAAMNDEMGQDVSETAVVALARLGRVGAEALEKLRAEGNERMRRRVARVVARAGTPEHDGLRDLLLIDPAADVRRVALGGLASDDARLDALFDDPDATVRAAAIARGGAANPARTLNLVEDEDDGVRIAAFDVIAARPDLFPGDETARRVRDAIVGAPAAASRAAVAWIALSGPSGAKGLFHALRKDGIPLDYRVGVIEALKNAGEISVGPLLKAAGDPERRLRIAALSALAGFAAAAPSWPNKAGVGLLAALNGELVLPPDEPEAEEDASPAEAAEAPRDAEAAEEEAAIDESLPLVPEEEGASTLDAILSARPVEAAEIAEEPPIELSEHQMHLLELSRRRAMAKKKMSLETEVAPYLDVRRFAARVLGDVVEPEATENLIAALSDDDPDLREAALTALLRHGEALGALPETAAPALLACLAEKKSEIRVLAARALRHLSGPEADERLHDLLGDADDLVRVEAVRGLDARGIADDAVRKALSDPYPGVCIAAADAVARNLGEAGADDLVAFALSRDGASRREVGRLLARHARAAGTRRLIEVLRDQELRRKWLVAIDALAEILGEPDRPPELKVA